MRVVRAARQPIASPRLALALMVALAAVTLGWLIAAAVPAAPREAASGGMSSPGIPAQLILKTDGEARLITAPQGDLPSELHSAGEGTARKPIGMRTGPPGAAQALREYAPLRRRPPPFFS